MLCEFVKYWVVKEHRVWVYEREGEGDLAFLLYLDRSFELGKGRERKMMIMRKKKVEFDNMELKRRTKSNANGCH